jgi:hypothetical protein
VSFDLFAQAFDQGSGAGRGDILTSLRPFATQEEDEGSCPTRTADGGEADFYVGEESFMVNHFSSGETLDLIVRTASSNGFVLLGPELPVMLTNPRQLETLPDDLQPSELDPVLLEDGTDLEGLIAGNDEAYRRCRQRLESASST